MQQLKGRVGTPANPESMDGLVYIQHTMTLEVDITGNDNGVEKIWAVPAGVWIKDLLLLVDEVVTGGTAINVGTDDVADPDNLVDNLVTLTAGTISRSAAVTAPSGIFLDTAGSLWVQVTGTPSAGKLVIVVEYYNLDNMRDDPNFTYTVD